MSVCVCLTRGRGSPHAVVRHMHTAGAGAVSPDVPGDGDLGSGVAELGERGVEQTVLLLERLFAIGRCLGFLCLEGHVRICNLWDIRHEEDKGQDEDEDRDG